MSTVVTVHRTTPTDQYLIVPNTMVRNQLPTPLRMAARCVLLYLLSLPEGWKMTRDQLDRSFVEGPHTVSRGIKELKAAGYLVVTKRPEGGSWAWYWSVTADPVNLPLENPQVGAYGDLPSTVEASTVEPSIKTEDLLDKKTESSSEEGTTTTTSYQPCPHTPGRAPLLCPECQELLAA